MKKLLNKTLKSFTIYALFVLTVSVPAFYYLIDSIWLEELDEHNEIIADRIENELNKLGLTEGELDQSIILWNRIQPGTNLEKANLKQNRTDSTYTILRRNTYVEHEDIKRFRGLSKLININGGNYLLTVETNVEETEETVVAIAKLAFLLFFILVVGFLILNKRLSVKLWKPFRNTLAKLKAFNLNSQRNIEFEKSNTFEFEELNSALNKLIEHSVIVFKSQKEFTENASHELQTPLAIIKNKLDLLLQVEPLTDRQYQLIEDTNKALTRVSRINNNLLLLAKIENHQYDDNEEINLSQLTEQCVEQLYEYLENKDLSVQIEIEKGVTISANKTLVEILLNNLNLNAIRHNYKKGEVRILLNKTSLSIANSGEIHINNKYFFRRFNKVSVQTYGSGLGLSIIQQICKRHNWAIDYQFQNNFHVFKVSF